MKVEEILQSITVQGVMLDLDVGLYRRIIDREQKKTVPDEFIWLVGEIVDKCESGQMDPWNVDLVALTRLFANSLNTASPNFSLAGRFIAESWKFLFEKSRTLLYTEEDSSDEILDEVSDSPVYDSYGEIQVRPRMHHQEKRKVMLLEVLESMRSFYQKPTFVKVTEEIVNSYPESSIEEIIVELNAEEPEVEKLRILKQIIDVGSEMLMEDVWGLSKGERSSFFAYSLFLAKERQIDLSQERPYGSITINLLDR